MERIGYKGGNIDLKDVRLELEEGYFEENKEFFDMYKVDKNKLLGWKKELGDFLKEIKEELGINCLLGQEIKKYLIALFYWLEALKEEEIIKEEPIDFVRRRWLNIEEVFLLNQVESFLQYFVPNIYFLFKPEGDISELENSEIFKKFLKQSGNTAKFLKIENGKYRLTQKGIESIKKFLENRFVVTDVELEIYRLLLKKPDGNIEDIIRVVKEKYPNILENWIKAQINILNRLGYIKIDESGGYKLTDKGEKLLRARVSLGARNNDNAGGNESNNTGRNKTNFEKYILSIPESNSMKKSLKTFGKRIKEILKF